MENRARRMSRATLPPPDGRRPKHSDAGYDTVSQLSVATNVTSRSSKISKSRRRFSVDGRSVQQGEHAQKLRIPEPIPEVVHFVYSEAVEKAIRRGYKTSAYPPLSGPRLRRDNTFLVHSLPNIYSDLVSVRRMRKHNVKHEDDFRKSMPDVYAEMIDDLKEKPSRFPRLRMKIAAAAASGAMNEMRKQRGGFGGGDILSPKLPKLLLSRARQLQHSESGT